MLAFPPNLPDGSSLEGLIRQACEEAAWRPAFYRQLLESRVLVIVPDEALARTTARPDRVHFVQWKRVDGTAAIPFFSSAQTFFEAVPEGAKCLVLDTRLLLELARGAILHLNPYSEFNIELAPADIEALLADGSLVVPEPFTLGTDRQVTLQHVADPPVAMLDALTLLYSQHPQVQGAYLALVAGFYDDNRESLLLGLHVDGDPEPIVRDSGLVIRDTYHGPYSLDIVHLNRDGRDVLSSGFEPAFQFFDRRIAPILASPSLPQRAQ